jgi:hypothetical protein
MRQREFSLNCFSLLPFCKDFGTCCLFFVLVAYVLTKLFLLLAGQFFANSSLVVKVTLFKWLKIYGLVCRTAWEFFNATVGLPRNII